MDEWQKSLYFKLPALAGVQTLTYSTNGSTLDFDSSNVGSSPARLTIFHFIIINYYLNYYPN